MAFTLDRIVPWGRSLADYMGMFDLHPGELQRRVLGCADGPASFNAEVTARGGTVLSADPLFAASASAIAGRIEETFETVLAGLRANRGAYVWPAGLTPESLAARRLRTMQTFLSDYEAGRAEGRYLAAGLPHLPIRDATFDLALCSHYLFTYDHAIPLDQHCAAILEMRRVAAEVRVFPLLALDGTPSALTDPVADALRGRGLTVTLARVPYEFQKGGDTMMVVR